jgi:hypothetical protein
VHLSNTDTDERKQTVKYEKVIKRQNGKRVRIIVSAHFAQNLVEYRVMVHICEPKKRTWVSTFNSMDYSYRSLSIHDRKQCEYKALLNHASESELHDAKLELWEAMKPKSPQDVTPSALTE